MKVSNLAFILTKEGIPFYLLKNGDKVKFFTLNHMPREVYTIQNTTLIEGNFTADWKCEKNDRIYYSISYPAKHCYVAIIK